MATNSPPHRPAASTMGAHRAPAAPPADTVTRDDAVPGWIRADVQPATLDPQSRTVDMVWTTGAMALVRHPHTGELVYEELSTDPAHVRMEILSAGRAPLLDAHDRTSIRGQIGVVVRASLDNGLGRATVRFSARPDVEPIWQDVRDGIIKNVSVGYRVHRYRDTGRSIDGIPVWLAVDWTPRELSLVPVPADQGTGIRAATEPGGAPKTATATAV